MRTYKDIEYSLQKSARKTASIYIERDGSVSLLVPESLDERQIEELIENKRRWIYTSLAEWNDLNSAGVQRSFVNGQGFLYLGRSYRLKIVDEQDLPLKLLNGHFCLRRSELNEKTESVFRKYYRTKGSELIPQRIAKFQDRMGVTTGVIRIQELGNRWGSCTNNGSVSFHWKCLMGPLSIIDYIVVHELAHLKHPNHSDAFWNEVDKVMPDYRDRKDWLRENGASMTI